MVGTSDQCYIPTLPIHAIRLGCNACGNGFRDVTAAMEMNHFTVETTNLINMSTGHCVDNDVKDNMIR